MERLTNKGFNFAKYFLLAVSFGVYMQWSMTFAAILLFVIMATFTFAILIERFPAKRVPLIWIGIITSLAPLILFKYINFILDSGASVLSWIGIDSVSPHLQWAVPIGLSFYTFQAVGYLWDVYRHKIQAERQVFDYMLFISFFPQILCGPISNASDLLPQLKARHQFNYRQSVAGLRYILWGFFLKLVLADRLGLYVDTIYSNHAIYSGSSNFIASIFYSFQIYGDFAGYSYIAIGSAKLLGINIIMNFQRPYLATSVNGFWKRWNISLTRWLTTYVYIPLGGNRKGTARTYGNIIITFLVSGIWHGANWTFIFWGALHGIAQSVERALKLNKPKTTALAKITGIFSTFMIVNLAWIFFRVPSIHDGFAIIGSFFSSWKHLYIDTNIFAHSLLAITTVLVVEIWREFMPSSFYQTFNRSAILRWSIYIFLTLAILTCGVMDAGQFIYVQF